MTQALDKAVAEAAEFRASFVRRHCRSIEDALTVAVAMMDQAAVVLLTIGGRDHAAAQFYAKADALAAPNADTETELT